MNMKPYWLSLVVIGVIVLAVGIVILNINFNMAGENVIDILGIVLAGIGAVLIILGVIFLAIDYKPPGH